MLRFCQIFFLLLFLLCSCGRRGTSDKSGGQNKAANSIPQLPYHRYEGTLAGKKIIAHLLQANDGVRGYYYYEGIGQPIELSSVSGPPRMVLEERGIADGSDTVVKHWHLSSLDSTTKGEWTGSNGKRYPLQLQERYPEGSLQLDMAGLEDSLVMTPEGAQARIGISLVVPYQGLPAAVYNFVKTALVRDLQASPADTGNWETMMKGLARQYFDSYRKDMEGLKASMPDEDLRSPVFRYERILQYRVVMNEEGWLVLQSMLYDYNGGAHGMYGSTYLNLDVSGGKIWTAADIFTDTTALLPLLDAAARSYFRLGVREPLAGRLLIEEVPFTRNVCCAPGGIVFIYGPYEIASYADGEVRLFVPYTRLYPFLQETFRKRMRLDVPAGVVSSGVTRQKDGLRPA